MIFFRSIILFLLFIFTNQLFSQKNTFTPLEEEINKRSVDYKDNINFGKARSFFAQKEWDSTLIYTAKEFNNSIKDVERINYCHFFRGYSFYKKKVYQESKKEFSKISTDFKFYISVDMYLGVLALEMDEYEKALVYFNKVMMSIDYKMPWIDKSIIIYNIGICYIHLKQYVNAESYLLQSNQDLEIKKDTLGLVEFYGAIANLYYLQYKDNLAIPNFEKAYNLSKYIKEFEAKRLAALNMAVVEENRKNLAKALVYRKEYEQWKDSLNNQNKIWEVAQIEKKIAIQVKQNEVNLLEADNKTKEAERNGLLYSAITLLLLLVTLIYFYSEKAKNNKIITTQKENLNELNTTKDKLFSIVSHDLRSSVNALKRSNTELSNNLEAKNLKKVNSLLHQNSTIVNGAYNLLDNILNWALLQTKQSYFKMKEMPLFILMEHVVHNYIPLMEDKTITFKNEVNKEAMVYVDQESVKIVLRNLLDNAIKFTTPHGSITIYTESTESYYKLIVEDTGLGISKTKREELLKDTVLLSKKEHEDTIGTGLGMQLCKSMIKKNKGLFSIESELGKGTKMIVSLLKTQPHGEH